MHVSKKNKIPFNRQQVRMNRSKPESEIDLQWRGDGERKHGWNLEISLASEWGQKRLGQVAKDKRTERA